MSSPPLPAPASEDHLIQVARRVLETEVRAIEALVPRVDGALIQAIRLIQAAPGRAVVTGMGKSGHIGNKLAATLASTGTPAFFVHPGEASHGDLGMITQDDVVLALSNSGETAELLTILPAIKRLGAKLIALTGNPNSTLATEADVHLDVSVAEEACPLGLAPSASTTAALAMGDALALTLLEARGFQAEDFARSHPGGALGRRLLVRVRDVMHGEDRLPKVRADAPLVTALYEMSSKGLGMTAVVDADDTLIGIYTDGDLRRSLEKGLDIRTLSIADVMHRSPHRILPDKMAAEAVHYMDAHKINGLLVVDEANHLIGALNMHDLFRAGVL
ncbi:MAG: KpsF/GutQ family sugar-phosphate isomerase [Pseudomonadota bacterium]